MRRVSLVLACSLLLVLANPAAAYETFIPLGTGYSTDVSSVPEFDSQRGEINQQADIFETEIYLRRRNAAVRDSYMNRFSSDPEVSGGDYNIDY